MLFDFDDAESHSAFALRDFGRALGPFEPPSFAFAPGPSAMALGHGGGLHLVREGDKYVASCALPGVRRDDITLERKGSEAPRHTQCKDLAVKNPAPIPPGFYPNIPKLTEYLPANPGEEKWIRHRWKNNSASMHPIHVHGYRFIVLSRNGQKEPIHGWKDTADLPPYGTLEYAIKLEGYPGEWLYHCHFEVHMETGFLGSMIVHDPRSPETTPESLPDTGHSHHAQ